MAIAFRGSASGSQANGNNVVITLSGISGLAEGDLVILAGIEAINSEQTTLLTALMNGGWTPIGRLWSNDTQDTNLGVWMKFMGATPDTSVTFSGTGGTSNGTAAVAMAFSGVDKTRPLDVMFQTATGISTNIPNPPSITPSGASGVWTVIVGANAHTGGVATFTFPTGYTTNAIAAGGNDTNDCTVGMGYKESPGSPEDPGVMTPDIADSVNHSWAAFTFALRPAETSGIFLVGSATGSAANGGDVTLTLPTCLENDLVIVAGMVPRTSDIDVAMTTSGYTEVADLYSDDNFDTNLGVFYKKMGSTPDTTAVFTGGGTATDGVSAVALVFRNVDRNTPMDATATTATGINSSNADPPSINQADTETVIVVAAGFGHASGVGYGSTFPPKYFGVQIESDDSSDSCVALGYAAAHLVSDPEDPGAFAQLSAGLGGYPVSTSTHSWAAVTMALRKHISGGLQPVLIMVGL